MKTIDNEIVKLEILTSAIEDISGLYEIIWGLNTIYPDVSENIKISVAQPIIKLLLQTGLVQLYKCKWTTNQEQIISPADWDRVIDDVLNWNIPNDSGDYFAFYQIDIITMDAYNKQYQKVHGL